MTAVLLDGDARMLYLTGTKHLQRQVISEFSSIGLVEIKGQSNYRCVALDRGGILEGYGTPGSSCLEGPCRAGVFCSLRREGGCTYYDAVAVARSARLVISNYAYWLSLARHSDPTTLGEFDIIVMDEAHSAPEWLTDFCAVELDKAEIKALLNMTLPPIDEGVDVWASWAREAASTAKTKGDKLRVLLKESRVLGIDRRATTKTMLRLVRVERDLAEMAKAKSWRRTEDASKKVEVPGTTNDWIAYETPKGARFSPVWAHQYAEEYLFRGCKKVVLSSGTLMPSVPARLGIAARDTSWHEVKSAFDPKYRPVIYIPTTRVDMRMIEGQKRMWINRIDEILAARLDRKTLIHSVSYARAEEIKQRSRYGALMLTHTSRTTAETIAKFKKAEPPCILVSPAVTEGVDFPDDEVRLQILCKVPFASSQDPLFKARCKADPNYRFECAALLIIQMCGRGMRSAADRVESIVVDDHFSYMRGRVKWPNWFRAAWRWAEKVPPPLRLLPSK